MLVGEGRGKEAQNAEKNISKLKIYKSESTDKMTYTVQCPKCWQDTKGAEDPSCQKMLHMNLVKAH